MRKTTVGFIFIIALSFNVSAQTKEARKIAELNSLFECDGWRILMDNFLAELQNQPQTKGFVVVYEGKYSKYVYDRKSNSRIRTYLPRFGEANYRTRIMLNHFKYRNFSPERYLFIDGGFRENFAVEFWIVPNGAKPPKSTPTLEKMKYRKGKPLYICDESY